VRRPFLFLLLFFVASAGLAACGDDGDDEAASTTTQTATDDTADRDDTDDTSGASDDSGTDNTTDVELDEDDIIADDPVPPSDDFPCDVIPTAAVADATGQALRDGEYTLTYNTRNEEQWTSFRCTWEGDGVDQEITIDVTFADGFPSGEIECPTASREAVEVTGAGEQTFWMWDGPLRQAELQACSADALVEVVADTWSESDEEGAQAALLELAALALAEA
jgi:hypothetical protein